MVIGYSSMEVAVEKVMSLIFFVLVAFLSEELSFCSFH